MRKDQRPKVKPGTDTTDWSDQDWRDEWWEGGSADIVTHEVSYQPAFRVRLAIPPWIEGDEVDRIIGMAHSMWNDALARHGEHWSECHPDGYHPTENIAVVEIENPGSELVWDKVKSPKQ